MAQLRLEDSGAAPEVTKIDDDVDGIVDPGGGADSYCVVVEDAYLLNREAVPPMELADGGKSSIELNCMLLFCLTSAL